MPALTPLEHLNPARFEEPAILKKLASSSRKLAELKGMAASIPNQGILINTLALQEATNERIGVRFQLNRCVIRFIGVLLLLSRRVCTGTQP